MNPKGKTIPLGIWLIAVLLIVVNVADISTTIFGISLVASELKPIGAQENNKLFPGNSFSAREVMITKTLWLIFVICLATLPYQLDFFSKVRWVFKIHSIILFSLSVYCAFIVFNNLRIIITILQQ